MRGAWSLALLAACFNPSPPTGVPCALGDRCPPGQTCVAGRCETEPGDGPDSGVEPIECELWDSQLFEPCDLARTSAIVTIAGIETVDTTANSITFDQPGVELDTASVDGLDVLFLNLGQLVIEPTGQLRVRGDKPLVIAAWDGVRIDGLLDGSGNADPMADVDQPGCSSVGIAGDPQSGGPGGSHAELGGAGGAAVNAMAAPAQLFNTTNRIAAGCPGEDGRAGIDGNPGGAGGAGGGAVAISTATEMIVRGGIDTSGAGGGGGGAATGSDASGGGGGGAGGHLILEAALFDLRDGVIIANGGGGGGGAGSTVSGSDGAPGGPTTTGASGGAGSPNEGNDGGDGGAVSCSGGNGGSVGGLTGESASGGGGGGACGIIEVFGQIVEPPALISPPRR